MAHQLLMRTFVPNPDKLPHINHIDGNKLNNALTNLEWCTPKYNLEYSSIHSRGIKTKNLRKTSNAEKPIIGFKGNITYSFKSIAEAARKTEWSRWGIRRCLLNQIKHTKGIV